MYVCMCVYIYILNDTVRDQFTVVTCSAAPRGRRGRAREEEEESLFGASSSEK
jgi:hypothetical protein